jgi:hypothetical protein
LSVEAETVTRFWLQDADGAGVGVLLGLADGAACGAASVGAPAETPVDETWREPPLNAPATAKPPNTMADTINRTAPANNRRRR